LKSSAGDEVTGRYPTYLVHALEFGTDDCVGTCGNGLIEAHEEHIEHGRQLNPSKVFYRAFAELLRPLQDWVHSARRKFFLTLTLFKAVLRGS